MHYSWMSQQTWQAWQSSWYMCPLRLWGSIKEDILFCKPLDTRTTGEDIYRVLDSFVTSNGRWWSRCVGICTDCAKAMTGRHSGGVTRVQAVAPNATWVHCSIHREAVDAKGMPDSLKDVLDTTVKMVNFVKTRLLKSCVFSALCNDKGSDHVTLLQHTEVRWLSRGKVLTCFFNCETSLKFNLLTIIFTCLTACMLSFSHDWPICMMFFLAWMIWI